MVRNPHMLSLFNTTIYIPFDFHSAGGWVRHRAEKVMFSYLFRLCHFGKFKLILTAVGALNIFYSLYKEVNLNMQKSVL